MIFRDPLYGEINFNGTPYYELLYELLNCPEVQRLRHVRLMNYDVPFIQDLASIKRLPHSLGTCYLTFQIVERSALNFKKKQTLIAAALLHDIGILPYGHLLEFIIKKKDSTFSHERIVFEILNGTYHKQNKYHQILPSASLKLFKVLRRYNINLKEIFELICPIDKPNAISADIDLDNIDNVHRMGYFLGYNNIKENLASMINSAEIDKNLQLTFATSSTQNIKYWQELRQRIYTIIIAHPYCVAYNSFLNILLSIAVENNVISSNEWFLTDNMLEEKLLDSKITHNLATQLLSKNQYELLDYVWISSKYKPSNSWQKIENSIIQYTSSIENKYSERFIHNISELFIWYESKIISKEVRLLLKKGINKKLGFNSYSMIISGIRKREGGSKPLHESISKKNRWRKNILELIKSMEPEWEFYVRFPEDFTDYFPPAQIERGQFELFK